MTEADWMLDSEDCPDVFTTGMGCCGCREINGISDAEPLDVVRAIGMAESGKFRHAIFTSIDRSGNVLARFIRTNRLGTIVRSQTRVNPNTGNMLTVFVWTIDWEGMRRYAKKRKKDLKGS